MPVLEAARDLGFMRPSLRSRFWGEISRRERPLNRFLTARQTARAQDDAAAAVARCRVAARRWSSACSIFGREAVFAVRQGGPMKSLVWIAVLVLAVAVGVACGGKGYSSPTSPAMSGTPPPGPTPTPSMRY
jgi:hypothetical protein